MEEFTSGFSNYVTNIQPLCTEYGLAKIVPPKEWNPRKEGWFKEKTRKVFIQTPIFQYVNGLKGIFQQTNVVAKSKSVAEFQKLAEKALASRGTATSDADIERRFWKNIRFDPPMYGADMKGSLFDPSLEHWNVSKLSDHNLLQYLGKDVDGVNVSYLYFGMWKAMFSWHTEDMDLFSINYLHYGEPKRWYVIPEAERHRFEQLAVSHFPDLHSNCKEFLRHKTTMISPTIVKSSSISIYTAVQREGEFMITFPGAYHAGFNHGFNCAESVNFAVESWISRGLKASICSCNSDSVVINMDVFLENYREFSKEEEQTKPDDREMKIPVFTLLDEPQTIKEPDPAVAQPEEPAPSSLSLKIPLKGPKKTIKKKKRKKARKEKLQFEEDCHSQDLNAQDPKFASLVSVSHLDKKLADLIPVSFLPSCLVVPKAGLQLVD